MKYLIFLDIDGTLLTYHGVHPRTVAALRAAVDAGHLVFINTGRSRGNIPFDALRNVPLTGTVAGLGSYIEIDGNVLHSVAMTVEDIAFAMHTADAVGTGLVLEAEEHLVDYRPEHFGRWPHGKHAVQSIDDLCRCYPTLRVSKISFTSSLPDRMVEELGKRFAIVNHPTYAEIGTRGQSKATAMALLQKHFGIDRAHVIAMGDSLNDLEMLRAAGIAVVMGDGHPDVKPLADFISIAAHEGGVGQAIEELILKS
jgi:hydroxymethylpyrimidine pyrophosphatase-like HAD family hydrolase